MSKERADPGSGPVRRANAKSDYHEEVAQALIAIGNPELGEGIERIAAHSSSTSGSAFPR